MKKLMAMIGAVAMAFGLYADGYGTLEYSPAGLADGTKTIVGYTDDATTPYTTAGSVINWWSTNCQEEDFEQPATVVAPDGGTSYLQIDTEGTPMLRTFNQVESGDSAAQAIEPHGLFVDMKVQLTGFEPDSEVKAGDGNKLLVWLKAGEGDEGIKGVTNLMVTCGYWDEIGEVTATNYELVAMNNSPLNVKPGDWVQFTVRANQGAKNVPTFNIYVNQQQVKAKDEDLRAFPSLIKDASAPTLKAAGFEGNGAIENVNLYGQADAPAWAADPTIMNIVWDANVKSLKINDVDVIAAGEDSPLAYPVPFGEEITATIEYKQGYRKSSVTGPGLIDFEETDDGATFKVAQYATVADTQLIVVSELDRNEAGLVIDGTDYGTFSSLAGVFAKMHELYPEDPGVPYPQATITVNENATADDFGFDSDIYPDITIDLNGKTIECTNDVPDFVAFNAYGVLEIIDTSVSGGGKIIGNIYADIELDVREAAQDIVIDGDIDYAEDEGYEAYLTIERGKFNDPMPAGKFVQLGKEGEEMEWDGPDKDGFYVLRAAEPPVPGEKGFKVIISGVETQVDTLAEALASADNNTTITFLADVTDATGMTVDTKKTLTVDFAGFTYTVNKPGAGSPSTMTQAFQLLKGQTLTFKNGTIRASVDNLVLATVGKNIKRFFQSYANFTLEDMTLDGTNLYLNPTDNAMCEFANGTVAITGDTTILANKENLDAISIDTWKGKYPAGVNVTIDTTGTISSVKVWTEGTGDFTPGQVALEAGTITELKVDGNDADYAIAKSEDVTITTTPAGYFWDNNVLAKCAAEIDGTYYNTLAAAFTAAQADDEIVLLKNVELEAPIKVDKKVTLNIGDFDITPKAAFTRPDGSKETIDAMFAVRYGGDFTVLGETGVIDCSAFPTIYSPIKLTEYGETSDGTLRAKLTIDANLIGYYYAIVGNGKRPGTEITINGGLLEGTLVNESAGIYHPQGGTLTINGGTIKGDTGLYIKAGDCICSVGSGATIIATGTKKDYVAKTSGFQSTGDAFVIDNADYPGGTPNADIKGGEFISANGAAVASYAKAGFDPIVGFVTGGTFTGAVKIDDAIAGGNFAFGPFTPGEPQQPVPAVARIDNVNYASLAAALTHAVGGKTITFLADITENASISGGMMTLDLNGNKLTGYVYSHHGSDVTITNGTVTSDGGFTVRADYIAKITIAAGAKIINTNVEGAALDAYDGCTAIVEAGAELVAAYNGIVAWNDGSEGNTTTLTVNGKVTGTSNTGISGNGNDKQGTDITIGETAEIASDDVGIFFPNAGTLTVNGGTITAGNVGIYAKSGTVNITGGNITALAETVVDPVALGDGTGTSAGYAVVLETGSEESGYANNLNFSISGGKFTSVGPAVYNFVREGADPIVGGIAGGDFADTPDVALILEKENMIAYWANSQTEGYVTPAWKEALVSVKVQDLMPTSFETAAEALAAVQAAENLRLYPIVVKALAEGGLTIENEGRKAWIPVDATITITAGKWTVALKDSEAMKYSGAIDGTLEITGYWTGIETFTGTTVTLNKDAKVTVNNDPGNPHAKDPSWFTCGAGEGYKVVDDENPDWPVSLPLTFSVEAIEYKITYMEDETKEITGLTPATYTIEAAATLPTKLDGLEGGEFKGWYTSKELTGDPVTEIPVGETGDKTFYAKIDPVAQDITVTVKKGNEIASVTYNGKPLDFDGDVATLTLPAETTAIELTLAAQGLTIPVFEVSYKGITGIRKHTATDTYAVKDNDELTFSAVEAENTSVDDTTAGKAVVDAATTEEAKAKATDLATHLGGSKVATWITQKAQSSVDDALAGDYVKSSIMLNVAPIDETTEIKIETLSTGANGALTFEVKIEDETAIEAIKDMVEASSDLSAWDAHKLQTTAAYLEGKVTITPVAATDKAFMKVVIPKDAE